ncbi:MAG: penicillin acylase family protein [Cyclobacteriaceae bacterium]|nr:penicillin acylase family protein [Cyclobacteriaceae bacterium]
MRIVTLIGFVLILQTAHSQTFTKSEIANWQNQARRVTIIRDTWGVPHIYGKTDADAVFGFLYAQCEDDFPRVELNYITSMGRLAEVEGEEKLYHDLRQRLFYDTLMAEEIYKQSPAWLKRLCNAFADGANYYLYTHPEIKPKLIKRFQPWMPFLFSEGSIGGDIESISVNRVKEFYGTGNQYIAEETDHNEPEPEPRGSNGFAIAPKLSASGNALLLINPHTSFYFRPEVHVNSEEGLNAYGAVTWGQFFIYQGFNEYCGWMHTSSQADVIDEFIETIVQKHDSVFYKHGNNLKPVRSKKIVLAYKDGTAKRYKEFSGRFTHHGPVIGKQDEKWVSISLMVEPLKALTQSYQRTKAKGYNDYNKVMELKANSSNNTVFADRDGNIAYWHGNFIPKRNPTFDWSKPVDGSNPQTDWQGLHGVNEIVQSLNPANGWIQNCNSTPFTLAGKYSPDKNKYPAYMAPDGQNARGINAERVLNRETKYTLDKLIAAANDPYLAGFENLLPSLLKAFDTNGNNYAELKEPIEVLRAWNLNYGKESVGAALAMYWGIELRQRVFSRIPAGSSQLEIINYMTEQTTAEEKLTALATVVAEFNRDFGKWNIAWGEVNRFQRLTGNINETFDDSKPSLAVASASSFWGSLAAFGSRKYPGTNKMYGYVGNSFVAVVEFGKTIKAKSVLAGGNNNNPQSPYFTNQAQLYSDGQFKDVWFYKKDVEANAVRKYQPGK